MAHTSKSIRQIQQHIGDTPNIKKTKKFNYRQTNFKPQNPSKYVGSWPIKLRSSWEIAFARKCDLDSNIIKWASESFVVPYIDPTKNNTKHLYYTDFDFTAKTNKGVQSFVVEIKPKKELSPPQRKRFKSEAKFKLSSENYIRNQCKWRAAEIAAKKYGMKFIIVTEENLVPSNYK